MRLDTPSQAWMQNKYHSGNCDFSFKTLVNICTFLEAQRGETTTLYWGVVPDPPLIGEWHRKLIKIRIWGWPELENFNFKTNPCRKRYICNTNESSLITKRYNKRNILMPNPPPIGLTPFKYEIQIKISFWAILKHPIRQFQNKSL